MDWCHESVMCVGVQCGKTCCFMCIVQQGAFFIKRCPKFDGFHAHFEPSSFIREFLGKIKFGGLKNTKKKGRHKHKKGPRARSTILYTQHSLEVQSWVTQKKSAADYAEESAAAGVQPGRHVSRGSKHTGPSATEQKPSLSKGSAEPSDASEAVRV